jgi:hypothetical protein
MIPVVVIDGLNKSNGYMVSQPFVEHTSYFMPVLLVVLVLLTAVYWFYGKRRSGSENMLFVG